MLHKMFRELIGASEEHVNALIMFNTHTLMLWVKEGHDMENVLTDLVDHVNVDNVYQLYDRADCFCLFNDARELDLIHVVSEVSFIMGTLGIKPEVVDKR